MFLLHIEFGHILIEKLLVQHNDTQNIPQNESLIIV